MGGWESEKCANCIYQQTPESKYIKIEYAQKRKNNCESWQILQIVHILYVRGEQRLVTVQGFRCTPMNLRVTYNAQFCYSLLYIVILYYALLYFLCFVIHSHESESDLYYKCIAILHFVMFFYTWLHLAQPEEPHFVTFCYYILLHLVTGYTLLYFVIKMTVSISIRISINEQQ